MEVQASYEGRGVGDETGKPVHLAQVKSSVQDQDDTSRERTAGYPPATGKDDKKTHYSAGTCTSQTTEERTATGKEAASAQAVKRGHQVTMIEVPDDEDNMFFRKSVAKGSPTISPIRKSAELPTPPDSPKTTSQLPNEGVGLTCVSKNEVTSPTVAASPMTSAKVREAPHQWFRPFEVD